MKQVLVIQHVVDDPVGLLGDIMRAHGVTYHVADIEAGPLPDAAAYGAIVILGGSQHANDREKYPYFVPEDALILQAVEEDIPLLGICLGGQLLARALGGAVTRHHLREVGFYDVALTDEGRADPLYQGVPEVVNVFHWHEDVFDLPPGATHLAKNLYATNQAFRYGKRAYGLQYHIELNADVLDSWVHRPDFEAEFIDMSGVDAYNAIKHTRLISAESYWRHARQTFENFLKISTLI